VNLDRAQLSGVISASTAKHAKDTITSADYKLLGEVTNTVGASINNGVQVNLKGSIWTVTGNSYLSTLSIDAASSVVAAAGSKVALTVNGAAKPLKAGSYKGQIVLMVSKG
jgi:membrane protein implicated in regulation of membrane protease activity